EPDEEDELAEDAAVPADHGELHADAGSRVPVHERREREHERRDPRHPLARRPQTAGGGSPVSCRGRFSGRRRIELEEVWGFYGGKYGEDFGRKPSDRSRQGVCVLDEARKLGRLDGDYVEFVTTGAPASGAFHCSDC